MTRREANITLQIDVIHTTEFLLPGRFFELNIHYGVFIGGRGDFNELFLGKSFHLFKQSRKSLRENFRRVKKKEKYCVSVWRDKVAGARYLQLHKANIYRADWIF